MSAMDPQRLARLRSHANGEIVLSFIRESLAELLADRDHHAQRADFLARLAGGAICRATCIDPGESVVEDDAAIAEHALTTVVEHLRARAETAERERDDYEAACQVKHTCHPTWVMK